MQYEAQSIIFLNFGCLLAQPARPVRQIFLQMVLNVALVDNSDIFRRHIKMPEDLWWSHSLYDHRQIGATDILQEYCSTISDAVLYHLPESNSRKGAVLNIKTFTIIDSLTHLNHRLLLSVSDLSFLARTNYQLPCFQVRNETDIFLQIVVHG